MFPVGFKELLTVGAGALVDETFPCPSQVDTGVLQEQWDTLVTSQGFHESLLENCGSIWSSLCRKAKIIRSLARMLKGYAICGVTGDVGERSQ